MEKKVTFTPEEQAFIDEVRALGIEGIDDVVWVKLHGNQNFYDIYKEFKHLLGKGEPVIVVPIDDEIVVNFTNDDLNEYIKRYNKSKNLHASCVVPGYEEMEYTYVGNMLKEVRQSIERVIEVMDVLLLYDKKRTNGISTIAKCIQNTMNLRKNTNEEKTRIITKNRDNYIKAMSEFGDNLQECRQAFNKRDYVGECKKEMRDIIKSMYQIRLVLNSLKQYSLAADQSNIGQQEKQKDDIIREQNK